MGYAYAVIPDKRLRHMFNRKSGHTLAEITCLGYYSAEAAYRHGEPWRRELISYLRTNRDLLTAFCREKLGNVLIPDIEATYLAWLDFRPTGITEPNQFLEKEAALFLSDGRLFGAPGHTRLNFGCSRALLQEAITAMGNALGKRPRLPPSFRSYRNTDSPLHLREDCPDGRAPGAVSSPPSLHCQSHRERDI